ncbi:ribosomal-protein-alanine N-acetyltransferase [Rubripirellula lacrimiformis]|uniref:Ribosomal-protein-alanine N-acetyltransferase n=1 Tax=Rubripirellula lacrimiformis TaxID=1930273 RepID=A0A517NDL0_9BACT|nr:N-acetyltransferase [Rubripirellula lacrimiformis]QDT05221.1 ribosomal-protein-alanine N-acetyltransferase [Rubripirellula lacrimiformis]
MTLRNRIQQALKQERGIRLSAAEVQGIASALRIDFPVTRPRIARRSKPSSTKTPIEGHVRWMIHQDLKDVLAIDVAATCSPWCKEDYQSRLSQRNVVAMVIELPRAGRRKPVVVGSMVYQLHKQHVELERIFIEPEYQLRSFGRQLISELRSRLTRERRTRIKVTVEESNLRLLLFFQAVGFSAVESSGGRIVMEHWWNDAPSPFRDIEKRQRSRSTRSPREDRDQEGDNRIGV